MFCRFLKDLLTRISKLNKENLKHVYSLKRYEALKFEFPAILLLKLALGWGHGLRDSLALLSSLDHMCKLAHVTRHR